MVAIFDDAALDFLHQIKNPSRMLQKGFLKPRESREDIRALKRRRAILFGGIGGVLCSFIFLMMGNFQAGWLIAMIGSLWMIFISLWMNFFANKKRRD